MITENIPSIKIAYGLHFRVQFKTVGRVDYLKLCFMIRDRHYKFTYRGANKGSFRDSWREAVALHKETYPERNDDYSFPSYECLSEYLYAATERDGGDLEKVKLWLNYQNIVLRVWGSGIVKKYQVSIGGGLWIMATDEDARRPLVFAMEDRDGKVITFSASPFKRGLQLVQKAYDHHYRPGAFLDAIQWDAACIYRRLSRMLLEMESEVYGYRPPTNQKWLVQNFPLEHAYVK